MTSFDIFVDGYLAHTFSPQDAHSYFTLMFRTSNFGRHISSSQGMWYIMPNVPYEPQLSLPVGIRIPGQSSPPPLDFSVRTTQGTVVPQWRQTPIDEVDSRRRVEEATLQLPLAVFFVNRNGGVGFWLPDILQGRDCDLYNRDSQAPLGGGATAHIRINVSSQPLMLADGSFISVRRLPS